MKPVSLFGILSLLLFQSCFFNDKGAAVTEAKDEAGQEVRRTFYPDGSPHKEMRYKNGLQHGVSIEFYRNGKVFQEVNYVANWREGIAKRYFESGKLSQETPYKKDKMHGIQKRYRRSGDLMAEVPYHEGNLCIGLKEYTTDGKLKKRYPVIEFAPIDNILLRDQYTLTFRMSDDSKGVEYYMGTLTEGKYIGSNAARIYDMNDGESVGQLQYPMPKGAFFMETINIIAKVKTAQSNYYITQEKFHLAIENR